jgi:hypothetical protein
MFLFHRKALTSSENQKIRSQCYKIFAERDLINLDGKLDQYFPVLYTLSNLMLLKSNKAITFKHTFKLKLFCSILP